MHKLILVIALYLSFATPVMAQGVFDMGVLTNTLSIDTSPRSNEKKSSTTVANSLSFKVSSSVRIQYLTQFLAKVRSTDPDSARDLERLLSDTDAIGKVGKSLAAAGLKPNNVADVYAIYWIKSWLGSRGRNEELPKFQIIAVRNQVAKAMLATPQFTNMTDAQKQELAESMLIQAALIPAFIDSAKSDPVLLDKLKISIAQGARGMGLDLNRINLTPQGFRTIDR